MDNHITPITTTDGLDLRPSDMVLHAELAMYTQRIGDLQLEITQRLERAKENGSFDTFAETVLKRRLELLVELVANCDECLAAD